MTDLQSTQRFGSSQISAIVLAAGRSRRMNSSTPKVLHGILGMPLVEHVVRAATEVGATQVVVVAGPDQQEPMRAALSHLPQVHVVVQDPPLGTAHAVLAAKEALAGIKSTTLVLLGDAPCISPDSLQALLDAHRGQDSSLTVLSGRTAEPTGYGRIVRDQEMSFLEIVEEKDATPEQREIQEINSGCFALELPALWKVLEAVEPSPATGERYATDAVKIARAVGLQVVACPGGRDIDVLGVNDRVQLAAATKVLRERILEGHMREGVTIVDPASTFIDARATFGRDVRIEPFSVISGATHVADDAVIGPFAHLRGDSKVGKGARVGNFVEVVRSTLGADSRALHLSYVGDATVGERANVGAGTVFANWDGSQHHASSVDDDASLGSNTTLIGPSHVGAGARTGAGAVVKGEVPAGATVVGVPARPLGSSGGSR